VSSTQFSATVSERVFRELERLCKRSNKKRSHLIEEALVMYLKAHDDALIAQGCRQAANEDAALAKASRKTSQKALAKEL